MNRQVVTDIIGEVVRDLANPSFQFQKRKNSEEAVNGHENDEAVAEESKETPVAEEHVKEDISNPTEAASTQAMEANVQIETAVQYEEKETADSAHQLQAGRAEDPPEETPWHVLPEYRRRTFVDLKHPTHTILVSALRGVCGMSVVERYDERKKFNVQMLSGTLHVRENSKKVEADQEEHKDVQSATSLTIENTAAGQAAQQTEVEPITELQGETGNEGRKFLA